MSLTSRIFGGWVSAFFQGVLVAAVVLGAILFWWHRPAAPNRAESTFWGMFQDQGNSGDTTQEPRTSFLSDSASAFPRLAAEFEPQEALLLGCKELVDSKPDILLDIVSAIYKKIRVVGVVDSAEQKRRCVELLASRNLPAEAMELVVVPTSSMWIRDFGPIVVQVSADTMTVLDSEYVMRDRAKDDAFPRQIAKILGLACLDVPLCIEGGNLLSNGEGLYFSSTAVLRRNHHHGYSLQQIAVVLEKYYGCRAWTHLNPLFGEPTGHVDMFCTLVAPNVAVVGRYDRDTDFLNAKNLDDIADFVASVKTRHGAMKVERLRFPSNADGLWRSYTNVIFANDVLLVPTYPSVAPELDSEALALYRRLLPDWEVVGIDATRLIAKRGALHCISASIPRLKRVSPAN